MLGMIVACDRNGAIGKDGDLPWQQSTDLQRQTNHYGFNNYHGKKDLGFITRIIAWQTTCRTIEGEVKGVEVVSFDQAMEMEGWIIGGGQIYELFLHM